MEISTATHELLGHGSGKLFTEAADGTLNFDPKKVDNTSCFEDGRRVDSRHRLSTRLLGSTCTTSPLNECDCRMLTMSFM